jgi:hypothetical protein
MVVSENVEVLVLTFNNVGISVGISIDIVLLLVWALVLVCITVLVWYRMMLSCRIGEHHSE